MTSPYFPSGAHKAELLQKLKNAKYDETLAFPDHNERRQWHAYHYGWSKTVLRNLARSYPLDPEGKWYHPSSVEQVEQMYLAHMLDEKLRRSPSALPPSGYCNREGLGSDGKYRPMLPMWHQEAPMPGHRMERPVSADIQDAEIKRLFEDQDLERARLTALIINDRDAEGNPTPEVLAFIKCCVEQAKANVAAFERRNSRVKRSLHDHTVEEINNALARVRADLGVAAKASDT